MDGIRYNFGVPQTRENEFPGNPPFSPVGKNGRNPLISGVHPPAPIFGFMTMQRTQ